MAELDDRRQEPGYRGDKPFRVRWTTDERTPAGKIKRKSRSFSEEPEALAFKAALEGETFVDPRSKAIMFDKLADEWFASTINLAEHTRRGYYRLLMGHVNPYFKNTPQNRIDWLMVQGFVNTKLAEPAANGEPRKDSAGGSKYVRDMLSVISLVMTFAIHAGLRTDNPAAKHGISVRREKLSEGNTFTLPEAHLFVSKVRDPYKPAMWILFYTGIRPAEMCGLRVEHIDFVKGRLHAVETINFIHAYGDQPAAVRRGPTKSEAGDRWIPLPQFILDELAAMLARRSQLRGTPISPDEPLFESIKGGKPLQVDPLRKHIVVPALEAAGLPTTRRTYDTRHTHAFILIDDGQNMLEVAQRMGHDPNVLQKHYGHVADAAQKRLTDRLTELFHPEKASPEPEPEPEPTEPQMDNVVNLFDRKRRAQ